LARAGKEKMLLYSLQKYRVKIAALSEVRWIGKGVKRWSEYTMAYSGEQEKKRYGVAIVMDRQAVRAWDAAGRECR
jgi:hypothetical protein